MNTTEFKGLVETDPHSLADSIREGKIPFSEAKKLIDELSTPPLIRIALLQHPDCDLTTFREYYWPLVKKSGTLAKNAIIHKAKIMNNIRAVAIVLNCGNSMEEIKASYETRVKTFKQLVSNPHINEDFKDLYFEITGDTTVLSSEVQDLFVF